MPHSCRQAKRTNVGTEIVLIIQLLKQKQQKHIGVIGPSYLSNERVSTTNNANVQSNKILHKYILKLNVSQCPKKQMYEK